MFLRLPGRRITEFSTCFTMSAVGQDRMLTKTIKYNRRTNAKAGLFRIKKVNLKNVLILHYLLDSSLINGDLGVICNLLFRII